jgi:hypothetical protein
VREGQCGCCSASHPADACIYCSVVGSEGIYIDLTVTDVSSFCGFEVDNVVEAVSIGQQPDLLICM